MSKDVMWGESLGWMGSFVAGEEERRVFGAGRRR